MLLICICINKVDLNIIVWTNCLIANHLELLYDCMIDRPLRTRETISYKSMGVISDKDFLYEAVPEFLHTHAEESFHSKTIS